MNLKKDLEKRFRGWLPKEPDVNGIARASGRRGSWNKPVMGAVLVSLGVAALLLSVLIATRTDTVIDTSFVLEPDGKIEPYENGTYYHTHVISKSSLTGEVLVEGGSVDFTADGYNTPHLKSVAINQNYSLAVHPADDQYTFTFQNTGDQPSSVKFTLKETYMPFLLLVPAFVALLTLTSTGAVLIIRGFRKKPSKKEGFKRS
jgi:hypothetical protein